jgi:FkbM family methyltransferase
VPAPSSGSRARRLAAAAKFTLRHPTQAYQAILRVARATAPGSDGDGLADAMRTLTGLDIALTFERNGIVWTLPAGEDGIAEQLVRSGAYFGGTFDAVLDYVRQQRAGHEWVVDVGANVGTTTVPFAAAEYRVLAIEPVPASVGYLRGNVDRNGLSDRVHVVEGAVTADGDDVLLAVGTSLGSSEVIATADTRPVFEGQYGRAGTIRARGLRLDEVVRAASVPTESVALVWSDTQGSEAAVIETGAALWAAGVPLFVELWPPGLAAHGGVEQFVAQAREHFTRFVHSESLDVTNGTRGSDELAAFAAAVLDHPGQFTDILLLP